MWSPRTVLPSRGERDIERIQIECMFHLLFSLNCIDVPVFPYNRDISASLTFRLFLLKIHSVCRTTWLQRFRIVPIRVTLFDDYYHYLVLLVLEIIMYSTFFLFLHWDYAKTCNDPHCCPPSPDGWDLETTPVHPKISNSVIIYIYYHFPSTRPLIQPRPWL